MTREAFIAKYLDETVGLLVGAWGQMKQHDAREQSWATDGKFIIAQMTRAKAMLGRIWDDLQAKPPERKP